MNLKKEVVIVTGSSGRIGFPLCERLEKNYQVVAFDREGPPHPPPSVEVVSVDLKSQDSINAGLAHVREKWGKQIASVVHLAAYYDFLGGASHLYDEITVKGTERLLIGLDDFEVEQFLFSSTMLVHAPCLPGEKINESSPLQAKWAYPESKIKTAAVIRSRRGDIPACFARIAGVYTDDCESIPLAQQIQRIYERQLESHLFPGNLSHGQNFMHLEDLLDALVLLIQRRKTLPPDFPVLLGEPETLSYGELQKLFGRAIHGTDWKTYRIPKWFAKLGAWIKRDKFIKPWMIDLADDNYDLDISLARQKLGWEPKHNLRDAIPGFIAQLKKDPAAWYKENKLK